MGRLILCKAMIYLVFLIGFNTEFFAQPFSSLNPYKHWNQNLVFEFL